MVWSARSGLAEGLVQIVSVGLQSFMLKLSGGITHSTNSVNFLYILHEPVADIRVNFPIMTSKQNVGVEVGVD